LEAISKISRHSREKGNEIYAKIYAADLASDMAKPKTPSRPPKTGLIDVDPKACIAMLKNRVAEVEAIRDFKSHDDPRFQIAQTNIAGDVREIFGEPSIEFERYEHHHIWRGGMAFNMPDYEIHKALLGGIEDTKVALESLIKRVGERIAASSAHGARDARTAFDNLSIHGRVLAASGKLFADGHYKDAILAAGIALVEYVKERSGAPVDKNGKPLDNTPLMQQVFGGTAPILALNQLKTPNDEAEQQGMMWLFSGAALALRNPRAHSLDPDTPEYAVEAISFLSFLAKQLDTARKIR
jgi:uncharacterized protein (TIGR02391 family)